MRYAVLVEFELEQISNNEFGIYTPRPRVQFGTDYIPIVPILHADLYCSSQADYIHWNTREFSAV